MSKPQQIAQFMTEYLKKIVTATMVDGPEKAQRQLDSITLAQQLTDQNLLNIEDVVSIDESVRLMLRDGWSVFKDSIVAKMAKQVGNQHIELIKSLDTNSFKRYMENEQEAKQFISSRMKVDFTRDQLQREAFKYNKEIYAGVEEKMVEIKDRIDNRLFVKPEPAKVMTVEEAKELMKMRIQNRFKTSQDVYSSSLRFRPEIGGRIN